MGISVYVFVDDQKSVYQPAKNIDRHFKQTL